MAKSKEKEKELDMVLRKVEYILQDADGYANPVGEPVITRKVDACVVMLKYLVKRLK